MNYKNVFRVDIKDSKEKFAINADTIEQVQLYVEKKYKTNNASIMLLNNNVRFIPAWED